MALSAAPTSASVGCALWKASQTAVCSALSAISQVHAGGLAEKVDMTDDIENVIDHLKGDSHVEPIAMGFFHQRGICPGKIRSHFRAGLK